MQNAEFRVQNERQTTNVKRQIPNLPASGCPRAGLAAPPATAGGEMRATYGNRRLWITFWRRFWGVFWGGFLRATGPCGGVRGVFSADGVPLVRWASANFDFFGGFFTFLGRFLPVLGPYFALFPSMPCAYLYVNNFFPVSLAWNVQGGSKQPQGDGGSPRRRPKPVGRSRKGSARRSGEPELRRAGAERGTFSRRPTRPFGLAQGRPEVLEGRPGSGQARPGRPGTDGRRDGVT